MGNPKLATFLGAVMSYLIKNKNNYFPENLLAYYNCNCSFPFRLKKIFYHKYQMLSSNDVYTLWPKSDRIYSCE